jgi:hypothetical protein
MNNAREPTLDTANGLHARMGDCDIIAAYTNDRSARNAVEYLELAGIDGADYRVHDPGARTSTATDRSADRATDIAITRHVVSLVAAGAAFGVALGALLALTFTETDLWETDLVYSLLIGCIVFGIAGAIVGGFLALHANPETEALYRPSESRYVLIGVTTPDAEKQDRALSALRRAGPVALYQYDRHAGFAPRRGAA